MSLVPFWFSKHTALHSINALLVLDITFPSSSKSRLKSQDRTTTTCIYKTHFPLSATCKIYIRYEFQAPSSGHTSIDTLSCQYNMAPFHKRLNKSMGQILIMDEKNAKVAPHMSITGLPFVFVTNKTHYSWTSVIRPSVIRISLLSGHDLAVYIVYFQLKSCSRVETKPK